MNYAKVSFNPVPAKAKSAAISLANALEKLKDEKKITFV